MDKTSQWHENQHAYRRQHSTATAMLQLSDKIFEAADCKKVVTAMTIDESSAFDCINFNILDQKLELYGATEITRKWISSYLLHRSQFVEIGGKQCIIKSVNRGVPQGSVLGPTLFSVYINELPEVITRDNCTEMVHGADKMDGYLFGESCQECGLLTSYADDATYVTTSKDRERNQKNIMRNMEKIKHFLNANELCVNKSKTTLI